jgi:superfamily II DNA or RNA helicase
MLTITILDHNYSHLSDISTGLKQLLSSQSRIFNARTKRWKVLRNNFIDFDNSTVYTGLVPYIQDNIPATLVIDQRTFPSIDFQVPELTVDLRDYQIDYLSTALKERRMIIHASGGLGKTTILAALISALKELPCLILAPGKTIMGQLLVELKKLIPGLDLGQYPDIQHRCVIGLAGSLLNVPPEDLRRFQVVMVDEAHCVAAQQAHDVIMATNAAFRFGFTATPTGRSDGRDLVVQGLLGKIVELIDRPTAVSQGYLAQTRVDYHRGSWEGNFHVMEDLLIVNNPLRNNLIKKAVDSSRASSVLILVHRIDHGKILQEMFGPKSIFISGDSDMEMREEVRQRVKAGKYKILIASKILSAGTDIPQLELGVYAAGGKSTIETNQSAFRVSRPWNDLAKTWIDIYDSWSTVMEDHSKARLDEYRKQGMPVNLINFPPGMKERLERCSDS